MSRAPSCETTEASVCGADDGAGCAAGSDGGGMAPSAALAHGGNCSATAPRRWASSVRTAGAAWLAITLTATVSSMSLLFLRRRFLTMSWTVRTPRGTRPKTAAPAMMMSVTFVITVQVWRCTDPNGGNLPGEASTRSRVATELLLVRYALAVGNRP